jgi:hypothetical protein
MMSETERLLDEDERAELDALTRRLADRKQSAVELKAQRKRLLERARKRKQRAKDA